MGGNFFHPQGSEESGLPKPGPFPPLPLTASRLGKRKFLNKYTSPRPKPPKVLRWASAWLFQEKYRVSGKVMVSYLKLIDVAPGT
jgi:hypothetical protein